jgi:hypothetical protein
MRLPARRNCSPASLSAQKAEHGCLQTCAGNPRLEFSERVSQQATRYLTLDSNEALTGNYRRGVHPKSLYSMGEPVDMRSSAPATSKATLCLRRGDRQGEASPTDRGRWSTGRAGADRVANS